MNGNSKSLNVIASVGPAREVGKIELYLIPAFVKTHGHGADEGLDSGCGLVVRCSKSPAHVFIIEDLNFEGKVFF